jgi:hypothetical protein
MEFTVVMFDYQGVPPISSNIRLSCKLFLQFWERFMGLS